MHVIGYKQLMQRVLQIYMPFLHYYFQGKNIILRLAIYGYLVYFVSITYGALKRCEEALQIQYFCF